jgi:uroporphyrinogen decarboxylase
MQPLKRKDKPDFERLATVIRRRGGRDYVPFFELCVDNRHLAPMSGLPPPEGLNFAPSSPTFEASFAYYLRCMAQLGYDHGTINVCGFGGFPARRRSVEQTGRGFVTADDAVIADWGDFEAYPWPSARTVDTDAMARVARLAPDGLGIMTGSQAVFETLALLMGFAGMSMLLYDDPALVRAVADRIGGILVELYDLLAALPFVRGVQVAGDMGHKTGTFVDPAVLREMVLPWHRRFVQAIHRHGKIAILHCCGNLAGIMDDLVACGYDAKHSFEDALVPGQLELHRRYGDRICLLGGIDVDFLCRADEQAIRRRVRQTIDALAPDGGYVLGSGNSIPDYMPTESYWAMLDEGLKYGRS